MSIKAPTPGRNIVDENGLMDKLFRLWTRSISDRALRSGTGSPEGVVTAPPLAQYIDTSTDNLYYKRDTDIGGDTTKGWRLTN